MCSQIILKIKPSELSKKFGIKIPEKLADATIEKSVRGFMKTEKTPVIVFENGKYEIKEMYFSLCPSWSKAFPCEWSTYNARMEREQEDNKTKK